MAITQDGIKAIAIQEITSVLSGTGVIGATITPVSAGDGKTSYEIEEKTGARAPDPEAVKEQAEIYARVIYRTLTELAGVSTDVEGTYGSGVLKAKGTGNIV